MQQTDILVIGSGISGCIAALELADKGLEVILISSGETGWESSSAIAQGGIIYEGYSDSDQKLADDIYKAGGGLCNKEAVDQLIRYGKHLVEKLLIKKHSVAFDRDPNGDLSLTEEGAHSCARVIYNRDQTGRAIMSALLKKVSHHPSIHFKSAHSAVDLITLSHHSKVMTDIYLPSTCVGAYVLNHAKKKVEIFFARETILATGGVGEVYLHTTNPKESRGDGIAMAYRAGARIMNMEYVQFHPTAFYVPYERRFLISEALRGEGAELLSFDFKPFMSLYHEKGSLAPRDVVARSIYQEMVKANTQHLWLDISFKNDSWIKERFPTIYAYCLSKGKDLTKEPVPIVPAAHYSCGGIAVDLSGKTSIHRLRAIGEVACSGLHGANRLASTSLLEGLVSASTCANEIIEELSLRTDYFPPVEEWVMGEENVDSALIWQDWMSIKQTMWNYVGLVRDKQRLNRALKMLSELKWHIDSFYEKAKLTSELLGLRNGIQTALLITQGAFRNRYTIGCHFRLN